MTDLFIPVYPCLSLFRTERAKTIPCPAAHPHIGHMRKYTPGEKAAYVKKGLFFLTHFNVNINGVTLSL